MSSSDEENSTRVHFGNYPEIESELRYYLRELNEGSLINLSGLIYVRDWSWRDPYYRRYEVLGYDTQYYMWSTVEGIYIDLEIEDWGLCLNPPLGIYLYPQLTPEPTSNDYEDDGFNHEFDIG